MKWIKNTFFSRTTVAISIAGGAGNAVQEVLQFPLERLKNQLHRKKSITGRRHIKSANFFRNSFFNGIENVLLYAFPCGYVQYTLIDVFYKVCSQKFRLNEDISNVIASGLSTPFYLFLKNPFDVIRYWIQIGYEYSFIDAAKLIYENKGVEGFFAGFISSNIRDIPFNSIESPLYYYLKKKNVFSSKNKIVNAVCSNFVASFLASFITHPFDVLTTKIMISRSKSNPFSIAAVQKIYKEEGISVFTRGIWYRSFNYAITGIFCYQTIDFVEELILKYTENKLY